MAKRSANWASTPTTRELTRRPATFPPSFAGRAAARVHDGLQYHLDVAATVLGFAGLRVPTNWDGTPVDLVGGVGRDYLVLSQAAWSCQRGVRFGEYLYLRTWHDGYHGHWADEMLFDVVQDPHETNDLWEADTPNFRAGASLLAEWTSEQLDRTGLADPIDAVRNEGGPFHVRKQLGPYLERLRATGPENWAEVLATRTLTSCSDDLSIWNELRMAGPRRHWVQPRR